jgi:hypothetical protein
MKEDTVVKTTTTTTFTFTEEDVEQMLRKQAKVKNTDSAVICWHTYDGGINQVQIVVVKEE